MSVYKEGFHAVAEIEDNSKQIFPDACDYGMLVHKNDSGWNLAKQLVEWYGKPETRKVYRYTTGATVEEVVSLMDEWNTGAIIEYKVTFVKSTAIKGWDGFVYVEKVN